MNDDRDERLGLPSASSFETDALCNGRQNFLRTLPPEAFQEKPDELADRGTKIHAAFETGDTSNLDDDDVEIVKRGLKTRESGLAQWQNDFGLEVISPRYTEERLYLHWPDTMRPATSARIDAYWISGDHGYIDEIKSLYCTNLTPAERNHQGRLQAVLIAKEHGLKHVRVTFNKAMFGKQDTVDYGEQDLIHAEQSIFHTLWLTQQPEAPRSAGPWCRYCPAKPYCPEAGALSLLPSIYGFSALDVSSTGDADNSPQALTARLSLPECVMLWERSNVITKILDAVKARLKSLPKEEHERLGLMLVDGRKLDSITNTKGCFDYLRDELKMSEDELWTALSIGKGDLQKALQRDQGWAGDATRGYIDQLVDKFGERKRAEQSLKKI